MEGLTLSEAMESGASEWTMVKRQDVDLYYFSPTGEKCRRWLEQWAPNPRRIFKGETFDLHYGAYKPTEARLYLGDIIVFLWDSEACDYLSIPLSERRGVKALTPAIQGEIALTRTSALAGAKGRRQNPLGKIANKLC